MPPKISAEVEGRVLRLSSAGWGQMSIVRHLKGQISQTGVHNILHGKGKRREAKVKGLPSPVKAQPLRVVTSDILKKVELLTSKEKPPGQREISKLVKVSQSTVHRLIQKLGKKVDRKTRVHKLTPAAYMKNRKTRSRLLYEQVLSGNKSEFVVNFDEAMFWCA
jgi:hypothetical protein